MAKPKTTIKRNRSSTKSDLVEALRPLIDLLHDQDEEDAAKDLSDAADELAGCEAGSEQMASAVKKIIEAFEGEHELMAYTHQRDGEQWADAEMLSQASSRVLSLARRLK